MPRVKIDYIVSFSSEDPEHPANNLLSWEVNKKKWLCSKGEPSCSIVLQLTQAVQICAVHIGAHHAALVEVLVGRSEKPNEDFQVLVPSSVFLSPTESRRLAAADRVRSFAAESLASGPRDQRWDRLRLVCSQPYNKHCKYGLSFVHVFSPESAPRGAAPTAAPPRAPLSAPLRRGSSSEEEEQFRPGELFAQHRLAATAASQDTAPTQVLPPGPDPGPARATVDTGAQIRQATSQAFKNIPDSSIKLNKAPIAKNNKRQSNRAEELFDNRQRDSIMYTDDDELPHAKIDHIVNRHKDEKSRDEAKTPKHKDKSKNESQKTDDKNKTDAKTPRRDEYSNSKRQRDVRDVSSEKDKATTSKQDRTFDRKKDSDSSSNGKKSDDESRKRSRTDRKRDNNAGSPGRALRAGPVSAAPHTLLRGVTFVLSGYQHPARAALRDQALAMGARCNRDWDSTCTHLICAFPNTPKLKQVRASPGGERALVVKGAWVTECSRRRRLLPTQWYATEQQHYVAPPPDLGGADDDPQSECDTDDEIERVREKMKKRRSPPAASPPRGSPPAASPPRGSPPAASPPPGSPPAESPPRAQGDVSASSDVTFVKDERLQGSVMVLDSNSDSDSTDSEEQQLSEEVIDPDATLPHFFEGCTFAIEPTLADTGVDVPLLHRYVRAYGGMLLDELENAEYVLCGGRPPSGPRGGRGRGWGGGAGKAVRADWVWRCHRAQSLYPIDEYCVQSTITD